MVPLYWIWTSTTTSIIKEFFVSENQYIGKLTILTTFFYYLCNANDIFVSIRTFSLKGFNLESEILWISQEIRLAYLVFYIFVKIQLSRVEPVHMVCFDHYLLLQAYDLELSQWTGVIFQLIGVHRTDS